jgi:hypothetical protein
VEILVIDPEPSADAEGEAVVSEPVLEPLPVEEALPTDQDESGRMHTCEISETFILTSFADASVENNLLILDALTENGQVAAGSINEPVWGAATAGSDSDLDQLDGSPLLGSGMQPAGPSVAPAAHRFRFHTVPPLEGDLVARLDQGAIIPTPAEEPAAEAADEIGDAEGGEEQPADQDEWIPWSSA